MNHLLVHPLTQRQLEAFLATPSHAISLSGSKGSGKLSLANHLAETLLGLPPDGFGGYAYGRIIAPEEGKNSISIEAVRELEQFLSLKVPSLAVYNRVIIIEDAHLMTIEAQNALLKTLEEPPEGTIVMLTASHEQALLPTIRSRVQPIRVRRPEQQQIDQYFSHNHQPQQIKQAYAISGGLPGLMSALLTDTDHPLLAATERARQLLSQSSYQRLLAVDELAKQRAEALNVTFILQQMAHVSLQTASGASAKKWQQVLQASYNTSEALQNSAQPKLALTDLMLSL